MPGIAYWERGYIIIPKTEWISVKQFCKSKDLELRERLYGIALQVYEEVLYTSYRKHKFDFRQTCIDELWNTYGYGRYTGELILRSMFPKDGTGKMFKPARCRFINKEVGYLFADTAHLSLCDNSRVLSWTYKAEYAPTEGDSPHWYPEVRDILSSLKSVTYVRGTGGILMTPDKTIGYGPVGQAMLGITI